MPQATYLRTETLPGDVPTILASLRTNGQYRSLVVREQPDGALVILAGNHTHRAFTEHGPGGCGTKTCGICGNRPDWIPAARCEVVQCDDTTATKINLVDNRSPELGHTDYGALSELLGPLDEHLHPLGAACVIRSQHGCLIHRGARKPGAVMVTASYTGRFLEDPQARADLHRLMPG